MFISDVSENLRNKWIMLLLISVFCFSVWVDFCVVVEEKGLINWIKEMVYECVSGYNYKSMDMGNYEF